MDHEINFSNYFSSSKVHVFVINAGHCTCSANEPEHHVFILPCLHVILNYYVALEVAEVGNITPTRNNCTVSSEISEKKNITMFSKM
jgi:hypothetical protein